MLSDGLEVPVGVGRVQLDEHLQVLGGASRLSFGFVFTKGPAAVAAGLCTRGEEAVHAHGVCSSSARTPWCV